MVTRTVLGSALAVLLLGAAPAPSQSAGREPLRLERVVLLMRHGVRPPTKSPPMPAGTASEAWPSWPVKPGYLTPHGREALRSIGASDRARWIAAGLLPKAGCPRVRVVADSDQRTIETARAYSAAIAPGCSIVAEQKPQDIADPIFSPINEGAVDYDPAIARAAVLHDLGPAGLAGVQAGLAPVIRRLDAILCGTARSACGVGGTPTELAPPAADQRPKLTGALDRASTVAQILLLEYADGKPMREVGWGRARTADIAAASAVHAAEFRILARPQYVAARNAALFGEIIRKAIVDAGAAPITMISGHDTNVAALGGLLDLHWRVPGLAADDPSPGGALVFERLMDTKGRHFVRAAYRSQTVEQIRHLRRGAPYRIILPIPGCTANGVPGLCTLGQFDGLLRQRLARPKAG